MKIAVLGCGQLAQMMAQAGLPMGLKFSFLAFAGEDTRCVEGLGDIVSWDYCDDADAAYQALGCPDVLTVEREQIALDILEALAQCAPMFPPVGAVACAQHRGRERELIARLGLPCSPNCLGNEADKARALPLPLIAKSLTEGYDGKGQQKIKDADALEAFLASPDADQHLLEQWQNFDAEVSMIAVRSAEGEIAYYPLTANVHGDGILRRSVAPAAGLPDSVHQQAKDIMEKVLLELNYVGVLTIEFFVVGEQLLINEFAPRVHNSGHWTQKGAMTSQFESHVRAISGLALGSTEAVAASGMLNLLGTPASPLKLLNATTSVHWYHKQPRKGRKLGHVNMVADDHEALNAAMDRAAELLELHYPAV